MALSIVQLFTPVQLGLASAVIYTAPGTPTTTVLKNARVRLSNTTGAAATATLYVDVAGNASAAANCCLPGVSIAANSYIDVDVPSMKAGDTLRGLSGTATAITVHELGGVLYS